MKLLDLLTSTHRPTPDALVLSLDELRKRLLDLNRSSAPYQIVDGSSKGIDLIAELKIVDTLWNR